MDLVQKLEILSDAAKYDVSCSSSGSGRQNKPGKLGSAVSGGICHSWSADGRCISLLKILFTNNCIYNCSYCMNRAGNDIPRASFTPDELAQLTISFYRRNYIEGLFLSSGVVKSPDFTMEQIITAIRKLRYDYSFNGYIHVKAIPGADNRLIEEAGRLVDRMSINIELPNNNSLRLLAPQKSREAILKPMSFISSRINECLTDGKKSKFSSDFVPAGQSTQLIIGATPDRDLGILRLSEGMYKRFKLKRVFYSAYVPVVKHPDLPVLSKPPLMREHRLYQADWLLRFYGFTSSELLDETKPDFDLDLDPKSDWALRNLHSFPIEVNRADRSELLKVPGIGIKSVGKILSARRVSALDFDDLKKIGVVLKRARFFITCKGKYYGEKSFNESFIRNCLVSAETVKIRPAGSWQQLSIFDSPAAVLSPADRYLSLAGEI